MQILRWILVIPAAVAGGFVAHIVTILVTAFMPEEVSQIVSSGTVPMGAILLGARTAPGYRLYVAALLVLLVVLLYGMALSTILLSGGYNSVVVALFAPVGIAGSVAALYVVYLQERSMQREGAYVTREVE